MNAVPLNTEGRSAGRLFLPLLFVFIFSFYLLSPNATSGDSRWLVPTALSILHEGNTDLNEYDSQVRFVTGQGLDAYPNIENVNGHYYSKYPLGPVLTALPFCAAGEFFYNQFLYKNNRIQSLLSRHLAPLKAPVEFHWLYKRIEYVIASFITAFSVLVVCALLLREGYAAKAVCLTGLSMAFCTSLYSTASRAMWQHGPSVLCISLMLYFWSRSRGSKRLIVFAVFFACLSYLMRPTNALSIAALFLYIAFYARSELLKSLLVTVLVFGAWGLFNFNVYGSFLPDYYQRPLGTSHNIWDGVLGTLVSPQRGLLIHSPVWLLALWGVRKRMGESASLLPFIALVIFAHWSAVCSLKYWHGGHSFGPRYFSDLTPYIFWLCAPVFQYLSGASGKRILKSAALCLVVYSFFVHFRGATSAEVLDWNMTPVNVASQWDRLWDWSDIQFLRGIND